MPYNASFSIVDSSSPSLVVLQDTSTGSDVNITGRTVTLYNADGSVYAQTSWPIGQNTLIMDVLSRDVALSVSVDVVSGDPEPDPSTYTYSIIHAFNRYAKNYIYYLTQLQTANPSIAQDPNYYNNKLRLFCEILSQENAIDVGQDVFAAQMRIAAANYMMANPLNYF